MKEFLQKNGILVALVAVAVCIIISVSVAVYSRVVMERSLKLQAQSERITRQSYSILVDNLSSVDKSVRAFGLTKDDAHLGYYKLAVNGTKPSFINLTNLLAEQKKDLPQYSNRLDSLITYINDAEKKLASYYEFTDEIIRFAQIDSVEMVKNMVKEDKGMIPWSSWNTMDTKIRKYETAFNQQAEIDYQLAANLNSWIQVFLLMIGLPTIGLVSVIILRSEKKMKQLLKDIMENNRKYLFDPGYNSENLDAKLQMKDASVHIQKSVEFIKSMAEGNYEVQWNGLNKENENLNRETLAGELVKMRNQLQKIKNEDDQRNWTNEGLSNLGEILRRNDNLTELCDNFLTALIKYLHANQGALFILHDDDLNNQYLELKSAYAYNRKKYINKKIKPGEGLAGQVWLEQETIYLREIPEDYLQIKSGLGGSNPKNLLVVPLKSESGIQGVLEMASFKLFEPHEIKFVEKIAESIAVTFSNAKVGEKTKLLLEQSQQQAEIMRSQEEEMRQNFEEMEATQEEIHRLLRESQHKEVFLDKLMDLSPYSIVCVDRDYKLTLYNQKFSQFFERQNVIVEKGMDMLHLSDSKANSELAKAMYDRVFRGETFEVSTSFDVGGHDIHFQMTYAPLTDEHGYVTGCVCFTKDVTEIVNSQKNIEKLLEETQEQAEVMRAQEEEMRRLLKDSQNKEMFLDKLMDNSPYAISCLDRNYRLILCNSQFVKLLENSNVKVEKGLDMLSLSPSEAESNYMKSLYDRAFNGEVFDMNVSFGTGEEQVHFQIFYAPILDIDGNIESIVSFSKNITDLVQSQKNNEKLLEETKNQAEIMKAQEEMMRQNMEEMQKKEVQYQKEIETLKKQKN
jgi:PAS domain S-box-containing protein